MAICWVTQQDHGADEGGAAALARTHLELLVSLSNISRTATNLMKPYFGTPVPITLKHHVLLLVKSEDKAIFVSDRGI